MGLCNEKKEPVVLRESGFVLIQTRESCPTAKGKKITFEIVDLFSFLWKRKKTRQIGLVVL